MSTGKLHVVAGPYRLARRFAERRGWSPEEYLIVTRGHQLAQLDPALILNIFLVSLHALTDRVVLDIKDEIDRVRSLWTVPLAVAS